MDDEKKILGSIEISEKIIEETKKDIKNIADFKKKIEEYLLQNVTELLDVILGGAVLLDVSDIHIEPEENDAKLRIRLDGILQDIVFFDRETYHHLTSRLKLLSKLKLNISDRPQDGRYTIKIGDVFIEVRTSSLPAEYGESIVMKVLNPKNLIDLKDLGIREDLYKTFQKEITKTNVMIILTGPTCSGKTKTLYAFLKQIQNSGIKIITIEDPIEYHLKGISQTQVSPEKGYTFADGLRSVVRQDPNVILVGEIRDLETAKIALQAALTGHLVLSTLHTNDAAGTIPRLEDLGADASSIASGLKMVVAQRLIRKVCKKCSTLIKPTEKESEEIKRGLKNLPASVRGPSSDKIKIAKIKSGGCKTCNFTGYKGRKGLFEAFLVDSEIEKFILTSPPVSLIREMAIKKGMKTIYQSGLIDITEGITTFEEVARVVEEDSVN